MVVVRLGHFISLSMPLLVVGDGGLQRLHAHDGAVHLLFGQRAKKRHDVFVRDLRGLFQRFTFNKFREGR